MSNSGLIFRKPLKHGQLYLESVLDRLGDIIHENTFGKWSVDAEFDKAKYIKSKTYVHEIVGQLYLTTAGSTIDPGSIKSVDEFNFCNPTQ